MTDYYYGSARLRALENNLIHRARIEELFACKSEDEIHARLAEYGISVVTDGEGKPLREATLSGILEAACLELEALYPDEAALRLWGYPTDCNNLKVLFKADLRGVDPTPMLSACGSVDPAALTEAFRTRNFSVLPSAMATAAGEISAVYAKNKNPQVIDLLADAACYADMLADAKASGSGFALDLVMLRIDLTNLVTLLRIRRMRSGEVGKMLCRQALLSGGRLAIADLLQYYEGDEDAFWEWVYYSPLNKLAAALAGREKMLTAIERCADELWMREVQTAKYIPAGPEVAIAYRAAVEYDVRNLRILLTGKAGGLTDDKIRERIRESYV